MRLGVRTWLVILVTIAAAWLAFRIVPLLGYGPQTSDSYLWGAFHVHSSLSDGLSSLEEIALAAKEARVDFLMLSDHGAPHPEAAVLDRTLHGVRLIGGSEVGLPDGHLIVSAADRLPLYKLPPYPPDAASEVASWGGISIVTYPEDPVHRWGYWSRDFVPDGIEIINVTSYFRAASVWRKLEWGFFSLFDRNYYLSGFQRPALALQRWDELLERGEVFGVYASNAHGGFPLTETRTVPIPSYRTALGYVGLGVDPRHRGSLEQAIRRGDFFSLVRGAGEPRRFELLEREGSVQVRLESASGRARIDLKRDGAVVASTESATLRHEAPAPGVYRAEVYLLDHPLLAEDVPWILSNPIFVGKEPRPSPSPELLCDAIDAVDLSGMKLEKDDESEGTLHPAPGGGLRLSYRLSKATGEKVDRWVALALRKELDLEQSRGIAFVAAAPERMRYWIEVRSGEDGHYASVAVGPGTTETRVPWERFYPTRGNRREIPLSTIDSLFVTVNTSSSRTGFSSELEVSELGFCR